MLTIQTIEELISVSCVSAIVARSGLSPSAVARDYGVDLEVRRIGIFGEKRIDLGCFLDMQLKASINWKLETSSIVFDLEADAYNRLVYRSKNASIPCVLILCCLTPDKSKWISVCEEELVFQKCCYYYFINGTETNNKSSKRIRIPRSQLLTPDSLLALKESILAGGSS